MKPQPAQKNIAFSFSSDVPAKEPDQKKRLFKYFTKPQQKPLIAGSLPVLQQPVPIVKPLDCVQSFSSSGNNHSKTGATSENKQEEQNNNLAQIEDKAQEAKLSYDQYKFGQQYDDTELAANEQEMEKVPKKEISVRKAEAKTELKVK